MSCNKYKREYCLATQETIPGHKRRYCKKCMAEYQKRYRARIAEIVRKHREASIAENKERTKQNG
jgi:hypothetical protein